MKQKDTYLIYNMNIARITGKPQQKQQQQKPTSSTTRGQSNKIQMIHIES